MRHSARPLPASMRRLRGIVRYRARSPNYKYVGSALLYRYFLIGVVRSCVQRRGRVADANAAERVGQQGRARHVPRLGQRTRLHRHAGRSHRLRARESVVGPTPRHATPPPTVACGGCGSKVAINKSGTVRNQVSSISEHFDDLTRLVTAWAVGCLPRGNPPAPPRTHAPTDRPARALRRAQRLMGMRHE